MTALANRNSVVDRHGPSYLKTLVILLLLFVDYAKTEVDLVGLLEIRLHLHDLGEGLFGMVQRPVSVVENTDTVP